MQFSDSTPIYRQVMDEIKQEIVSGVLRPGARLDSVRLLAARYGINLNTMQRACAELEREGVLETRRGIGSFVADDPTYITALREHMAEDLAHDYLEGMEALGFTKTQARDRLGGKE